jgi:hypothetical protein
MPTGVHFDGNHAVRFQHGDCRIEEKLLEKTRLYHVTYRQLRANFDLFQPSYNDRGEPGKRWAGLPLVDFTETTDLGGGVCEWTATYAKVPQIRVEFELFTFEYQGIETSPASIDSISLTVPSRVIYSYVLTNNPASIVCAPVCRAILVGSAILITAPIPMGDERLGEDESKERWMGNIWVKKTRMVPARPLSSA